MGVTVKQRRDDIIKLLQKTPSCSVNSIIDSFDVAPATIRRDLSYLEERGQIKRTHGGVQLLSKTAIPNYCTRREVLQPEKQAIAHAAAKLVCDNDYVILDSGTTTHPIWAELKNRKSVTVITNSLSFIDDISPGDPSVILTGGVVDAKNCALIGPDAEATFDRISASILFLAATGIRGTEGLTAVSPFQAQIKQKMISCAKKRVLVASNAKFFTTGMLFFASFEEIDTIITDKPIENEELLRHFAACNIELIITSV